MNENRVVKQIFSQVFSGYELKRSDDGDIIKTGEGGSGVVYEARRKKDRADMVVKVTGLKAFLILGESLDRAVLTIKLQQQAAENNPSILRISDFYVLGADIDGNDNVRKVTLVSTDADENIGADELHGSEQILIFSFMEKMESILERDAQKRAAVKCNNELLRCIGRDGAGGLAGNPDGVLFLAFDTATALRELKADNVAHRDVKPDNIFYDPDEYRFLLGDFGLARIAEDAAASTHAGTNGFLAPEIRIGVGDYDPYAGDIYSLGMTMYALLNGLALPGQKPAMLRSSPKENIQYGKDSESKIPDPRNGFPQINALIRRMITSDPAKRPGIDEVLMKLEDIAMDLGISDLDDIEYREADSKKIVRLHDIEKSVDTENAGGNIEPDIPDSQIDLTADFMEDYLEHMKKLDEKGQTDESARIIGSDTADAADEPERMIESDKTDMADDSDETSDFEEQVKKARAEIERSYADPGERVTDVRYVRLPGRFLDRHGEPRKSYPTMAQVVFVLLGIAGIVMIDNRLELSTDAYLLPSLTLLLSFIFSMYQKRKNHFTTFMKVVFPVITLFLAVVCMIRSQMNWQMLFVIASVLFSFACADIGMMLTGSVIAYEFISVSDISVPVVSDGYIWLIFTGILFIMLMLLFLNERRIRKAETAVINGIVCVDSMGFGNLSDTFFLMSGGFIIAAVVFLIIFIVHLVTKADMSPFMRLMKPQASFGIAAVISFILDCKYSDDESRYEGKSRL